MSNRFAGAAVRRIALCALAFLPALFGVACAPPGSRAVAAERREPADLIIVNARIYTVDTAVPIASALAIRDGRVLRVGTEADARTHAVAATQVIDLGGQTVIPGMTDSHAHLLGLGTSLRNVQLAGAASYEEVISRVAARARELQPGEWILGRGWDQNLWTGQSFPVHDALSRALPDNPVVMTRIDGHASLANALAMRLAGVTAATAAPAGGRIVRKPNGEPSGVFVDNAMQLVSRYIPPMSAPARRAAIIAAIAEANRWGLTGVHDAGESRSTIDIYEALAREGQFSLRNYVMVSSGSADIAHYTQLGPRSGLYDGRLWVRAIKAYADGALGSRGAALLEPYSDDPGNTGLLVTSPEQLRRIADRGLATGFQVNIHAIGDRGSRVALDAIEAALAARPVADHRFRIEHAQVIAPEDIPRFAKLGVIPAMQGSHQTSDMGWAEARVGPERIRGAYAWRRLLDTGVILPNGSDFPVEKVNPLISFHAAVTRQNANNQPPGGWYPDQVMTREEALRSMTIWPARAGFQEQELGSLSPGKYADFVVLDRDIMLVPAEEILRTNVLATYLGGRRIYERK